MRDNFIYNKFLESSHVGRSLLVSISARLLRLFVRVKIYYENEIMCFRNIRCKIKAILPFSTYSSASMLLHSEISLFSGESSITAVLIDVEMCVSTVAFKYRWEE